MHKILKNKKLTAQILTYAGILPFIYIALESTFSNKLFQQDFNIFPTYPVLIISFLCGLHWAFYMQDVESKIKINLFILSNVVALVAWFTQISGLAYSMQSIIYALIFIIILSVDYNLYKLNIFEKWFWKLRFHATILVSLNLLIFALNFKI